MRSRADVNAQFSTHSRCNPGQSANVSGCPVPCRLPHPRVRKSVPCYLLLFVYEVSQYHATKRSSDRSVGEMNAQRLEVREHRHLLYESFSMLVDSHHATRELLAQSTPSSPIQQVNPVLWPGSLKPKAYSSRRGCVRAKSFAILRTGGRLNAWFRVLV